MLVLVEKQEDNTLVEYVLDNPFMGTALPGAVYTLLDTQTGFLPVNMTLIQNGDHLEMMVGGEPVARLSHFFEEDKETIFSLDGSLDPIGKTLISENIQIPSGSGPQVIWQGIDSQGLLAPEAYETAATGHLLAPYASTTTESQAFREGYGSEDGNGDRNDTDQGSSYGQGFSRETTPDSESTPDSDTTPPVVTGVTIPNTAMAVGDTITVTISVEDDGGDTYTNLSGTVAGFALANLTRVNSTTYSATFTVTQGGSDLAAASDIPVDITIDDSAGNTSDAFTTAISQTADPIDANAPVITDVEIPDAAMAVGDVVTVTISVEDDGTETYTNLSGTVAGFALTNLTRVNSTTYSATFTVTQGGSDLAAASDIPVDITIDDSAGNTSDAFTTAISQSADPIDANAPVLTAVAPSDDATDVGATDNLTLTFEEAVVAGSGTLVIKNASDDSTFESIDISSGQVTGWGTSTITVDPSINFSDNTDYYVQFQSGAILDASGNPADGISDTTSWNFTTPDNTPPQILSFTSDTADASYTTGAQINITATASETVKSGSTVTITLDTGDTVLLTAESDGTTLTGTYTVGAGDTSADLTVLSFSIGSVEDLSGNAMTSTTMPAGNNISDTSAIVVDTTPPTTTISDIDISSDTGTLDTDFLTQTASQTITATLSTALASGEVLMGSLDNGNTWTDITTKVTDTTISWAGATLAGSSEILIKVTDAAGNDGTLASQSYVLDTTPPATTISDIDISSDTGTLDSDFLTQTASQTITATLSTALASGEVLMGSLDNGATWTDITTKVTDTTISWAGATLAGSSEILIKVTDAAGNDGTIASQSYTLDTTAPTLTFNGASYDAGTDTITLTGSDMTTLLDNGEDSSTDIAEKFDWAQFTWDINGDDAATSDITFSQTDILSVTVLDDNTLEVILTADKALALEGNGDYDPLNYNDTVEIGQGFCRDGAGNTATTDAFEGPSYTPEVLAVEITGGTGMENNTLNAGDTVSITVTMSAETTVTGTPQLDLNIGGTIVQADYDSGSGSTTLVFTYTIQADEQDTNGISVDADSLSLNGGTMTGTTGNDALITHDAVADNASFLVDAVPPNTPGLDLADDTGTDNSDGITNDQTVNVAGLEADASWEYSLDSGSTWTLGAGTSFELEADTEYTSGQVQVRQTDAAGNASNLGSLTAVTTDTTDPFVLSVSVPADGTYKIGDTLEFTVSFNETITTGTSSFLTLTLDTGGTVQATYLSSTADAITYSYTVTQGVLDTSGITVGALDLNGDTITDTAGNEADLTLSNVASSTGVLVDGVKPAIQSVAVADGDYGIGDTVTITITAANGETGLTLSSATFNGQTLTNIIDNDDGTYTATYTVVANDSDVADLSSVVTNLAFTDAAGNVSDTLTAVTLDGESIDAHVPTLTTSTPDDDDADVALDSNIQLTFNEDISLGTGEITITNGTDTITIDVENPGSSTLTIAGNTLTIDPGTDLADNDSTYHVEIDSTAILDSSGNAYEGIDNDTTLNFDTEVGVDTSIVVFDLVNGRSSDHSTGFSTDVDYTIYIYVDSDTATLMNTDFTIYTGGENLDANDTIILAGNDDIGVVVDNGNLVANSTAGVYSGWDFIYWYATQTNDTAATIWATGTFTRFANGDNSTYFQLWTGTCPTLPDYGYTTKMPTAIMNTQFA